MLELTLCSLLTILPDYLYRRLVQGKRLGKEITLYSVWFELRWGLVSCAMLTIGLITVVFYNHPATANVTAFYRTVPIIPETIGRVSDIMVKGSEEVKEGQPIFRLDNSKQQSALDTATKQVAELDAQMVVTRADLLAAEGQIATAKGNYEQALEELQTKQELMRRNPDVVARREIEKLQNLVEARQGAVDAAMAQKQAVAAKLETLLPAQKASAEAALAQAQVELDKTTIRAGVTGRVEQFALQVGDVVNPLARPAGILIPADSGRKALFAGFDQTNAQVMEVGMAAEATCVSQPWKVIPLVVTGVQDYIAAGQFRGGEQLIDPRQVQQPGTILVKLEPLYENGLDGVTPGSSCIANAYKSYHKELQAGNLGPGRFVAYHVIDTVALVHAMILRIQALIMPIQTLVFSGGHG